MALPSPESKPGRLVRTGKIRACAECRRLKLRCDRCIPCQSCIRRGCTALCPDKCFTDEATPSSLKATSLRNREQIQTLQRRVAALEEALAFTQPSHSLLAHKGMPSETGLSTLTPIVNDADTDVEETIDIFGSLSIGEDGYPVFHGATSMSEYFVQKSGLGGTDHRNLLLTGEQPILPCSIQLLCALFPFASQTVSNNSDINEMLPYIPSPAQALEITNHYWHTVSIGGSPISRHHFMTKVFNHFYPRNMVRMNLETSDAHLLGVLFITIALGILSDPNSPMLSTEAEKYHQLARAAMSLDPICDAPTIPGLQCMISIASYLRSAPTRTSTGFMWSFNGILIKLGSSIGIFRDSRRWLTDIDEIEQREVLCWELVCLEVWQSFAAGRPCSIDISLVDCRRPPESATAYAGLPGFIQGYTDWKYQLYPIINKVMLVVQRPGPVKYAEILSLELQLRECPMPEGLSVPILATPDHGLPDDATTKHLQRFTALIMRESACCMLHRRFLVLVMQKDGDEPTKTPFWYSAFQAGYSACWIVKAHVKMYHRHPELISRIPPFWSISFSAAVVLGAIVARYWNRDYARGTLGHFAAICALFEEAAGTSIQPLNALEILQRLRQRVQAKFPTSSDAAKNFNDLPLLGAQPSMAASPPPEQHPHPHPQQQQPSKTNGTHMSIKPENSTPPVPPDLPPSVGTPTTPTSMTSMTDVTTDSTMSSASSGVAAAAVGTTMVQSPNYFSEDGMNAFWSEPDLKLFQDNNGGGIPVPLADRQGFQASLPDGLSNAPMETFMPIFPQANAEAGQWHQFLDRLGVWE